MMKKMVKGLFEMAENEAEAVLKGCIALCLTLWLVVFIATVIGSDALLGMAIILFIETGILSVIIAVGYTMHELTNCL